MFGTKKRTKAAFYSVAARVETEVGSPAALLVTSALDNDGAMMVAANLAEVLVAEGYRVAVIDASDEPGVERSPAKRPIFNDSDRGVEAAPMYGEVALRDLGDRFAGSRRDVTALTERLRARYDYVIVCAPAFNRGSIPTLFANACDALLVAVVRDRSACEDDRRMNAFLDGGAKPVVGIVTTTKSSIEAFAQNAVQRPRVNLPANDIIDERAGRVPVVLGSM